jgi:hypothetical protein
VGAPGRGAASDGGTAVGATDRDAGGCGAGPDGGRGALGARGGGAVAVRRNRLTTADTSAVSPDHVTDHFSLTADHVFAIVDGDTLGSVRLGSNHQ